MDRAGWIRVKSNVRFPIPAFPLFGQDDSVETGAYDGVVIAIESHDSFEFLQSLDVEALPPLVRIGMELNDAIFSSLSPAPLQKARVEIISEESPVIGINIGKKM